MSATWSISEQGVRVSIQGKLGFEAWRLLRDARVAALERRLPMAVDFHGCESMDMGGLGSLLIAQLQLGSVAIAGCTERSARWFDEVGVCERCGTPSTSLPGCRRFAAA